MRSRASRPSSSARGNTVVQYSSGMRQRITLPPPDRFAMHPPHPLVARHLEISVFRPRAPLFLARMALSIPPSIVAELLGFHGEAAEHRLSSGRARSGPRRVPVWEEGTHGGRCHEECAAYAFQVSPVSADRRELVGNRQQPEHGYVHESLRQRVPQAHPCRLLVDS